MYANKNQEICGIKFDKTGEYADQVLRFNQIDENNGANGSTDMFFEWITKDNQRKPGSLVYGESVKGKSVLEININEFYTPDDEAGIARTALTIGHETFLHNRSLKTIMNFILKNEWAKANIANLADGEQAGIQGSKEHGKYAAGYKGFALFNSFKQSLIKTLGNDAQKAIKDHDGGLKN